MPKTVFGFYISAVFEVHMENYSGFHTMGVIASKVTLTAASPFIVLHLFSDTFS
jgi:hypothetical protein